LWDKKPGSRAVSNKNNPYFRLPLEKRIGDEPIEKQYEKKMQELGHFIDRYFNGPELTEARRQHTGFVLLAFKFGEGGRCNYISNANRQDIIKLFKEQISYFEGEDK